MNNRRAYLYLVALLALGIMAADAVWAQEDGNREFVTAQRKSHQAADDIRGDGGTCRVVRVDEKGIYINAGFDDKIEKNDVFTVVRQEDPIADPKSDRAPGDKQTEIAKIIVLEVLEKHLSLATTLIEASPVEKGDIVLGGKFYSQYGQIYKKS